MEKKEEIKIHPVVENLRKIMRDRGLIQATMAQYAQTTPSQFSKILNGSVQISIWQLSNIATRLSMDIIDLFTYPKRYVDLDSIRVDSKQEIKATLTIELGQEKKDQVFRFIFGDNDVKILNR